MADEPDESPISLTEMVEMFGQSMPLVAVRVLWETPNDMTVGAMRGQLRDLGNAYKAVRRSIGSSPPLCEMVGDNVFQDEQNLVTHYETYPIIPCGET